MADGSSHKTITQQSITELLKLEGTRLSIYLLFERSFVEYLESKDFGTYRACTHEVTTQFQEIAAKAKQLRIALEANNVDDDIIELCQEIEANQQRKLQLARRNDSHQQPVQLRS
eukprot:m.206599 g.206599  ORF g.206599 m.206599 type:complete len:115 (+) comp17106_c0_seq2:170-514(+)